MLGVCPRCYKEKLYINVFKQLGYCQRCGLSLGPDEVRQGFIKPSDREVFRLRQIPPLIDAWDDKDASAFLRSRNVTEDMDYILYDQQGRRLYFSIRSISREYAPSYHTRGIDEGSGWVVFPGTEKAHYVWGETHLGRVMLVEGIWDAFACGIGSMALLGTRLSETVLAHLTQNRIRPWIWMDPDDAGIRASIDIANRLRYAGLDPVVINAGLEPSEMDSASRTRMLLDSGWLTA